MIQIAVPSRESDAHYEQERHDLERAVSEVNGEHGLVGHPAIHYLHKNLPFDELIALYLAADIMLVTRSRTHEPRRQGVRDDAFGPHGQAHLE